MLIKKSHGLYRFNFYYNHELESGEYCDCAFWITDGEDARKFGYTAKVAKAFLNDKMSFDKYLEAKMKSVIRRYESVVLRKH